MTRFRLLLLSAAAAVSLGLGFLPAAAQMGGGGAPQEPPIGEMASALGVSETALQNCMPRPERGQRPERPDASAIAQCLNDQGASVTSDAVDDVLGQFGPQRR